MEGSVVTVVGRVVTAGIVAAASIVLGGSAQAVAMTRTGSPGEITSPSDGQVVSSSSVTVAARTGLMQLSMGLYVEGPSTPTQKVAVGGANQTISGTFDAGNAPNGAFTVTLKGEITGTRYATSTFKLRRPPETPGDVNASLQGATKVLLTWSKGAEPDLQSYEVSNSRSGTVGRLSAESSCDGGSCKATLAVPAQAAGQKVGFTVKAFRGDGDGGSIGSDESGAAYVTVPAAPSARPKKDTTKTRETPKETKGVDPLPTLPAKKRTEPTSKPATRRPATATLPAIPDADRNGNLPIPAADDQGELGGPTPEGAANGSDTVPVQEGGVEAQSNESPMGNIGQYGLYVAGGLLLLLLGAHAGAWARRRSLATEGGRRPLPRSTAPAAPGVPAGVTASDGVVPAAGAVRGDAGDVAVAATVTPPRRRPAMIIAVARTRVPDQSQAHVQPPAQGQVHAQPQAHALKPSSIDLVLRQDGSSNDRPSVHEPASVDRPGAQEPGAQELSSAGRSDVQEPSAVPRVGAQGVSSVDRVHPRDMSPADDPRAEEVISDDRSRLQAFARSALIDQACLEASSTVLPLGGGGRGGGDAAAAGGKAGEASGGSDRQEGHAGRQGPIRIALPSSAVTDVPQPSASVPRPAIRIEDRWDDYLPPSPRSMEDSGFWERPQPGAADFWAPDDDDADGRDDDVKRAYAGRRDNGSYS
jgi:hypothetical protein